MNDVNDVIKTIEAELEIARAQLRRFESATEYLEDKIAALETAREALDWEEPDADIKGALEGCASTQPTAAEPCAPDLKAALAASNSIKHHDSHAEFALSVFKAFPGVERTVRQLVDIAQSGPGPDRAVTSIGSALKRLVDKGEVSRREQDGKVFYWI